MIQHSECIPFGFFQSILSQSSRHIELGICDSTLAECAQVLNFCFDYRRGECLLPLRRRSWFGYGH